MSSSTILRAVTDQFLESHPRIDGISSPRSSSSPSSPTLSTRCGLTEIRTQKALATLLVDQEVLEAQDPAEEVVVQVVIQVLLHHMTTTPSHRHMGSVVTRNLEVDVREVLAEEQVAVAPTMVDRFGLEQV